MADHCELWDLPKDQCAHCTGAKLPDMATSGTASRRTADKVYPDDLGPTFRAKFESTCSICGDQIYKDDPARMNAGRAIHPDCA